MSDGAPLTEVPASPPTVPASSAAVPGEARAAELTADRAGREPGELLTGLSPRQIIGGFTLVAGIIVWLARRSRRKR